MGNRMNLEMKEGAHLPKVEKSLIQEFQDRIYTVDRSMTSFVNAIDSTEMACELLLRQMNNQRSNDEKMTDHDGTTESGDTKLAAKLLWTIKEAVSDHKYIVLECLSKMIHLMIDTGKEYVDCPSHLSIDEYRNKHNVDVGHVTYYDAKIENLQRELQQLKEKCQFEECKLATSEKRIQTQKRENEVQKKRIDTLQDKSRTLLTENERLSNLLAACNEKEIQIEDFTGQLTRMKQTLDDYRFKAEQYFNEIELLSQDIMDSDGERQTEEKEEALTFHDVSQSSKDRHMKESLMSADEDETDPMMIKAAIIRKMLSRAKTIFEENRKLLLQHNRDRNNSIIELQQEKGELEKEKKQLQTKVDNFSQELKSLKEREVVNVQVYCESSMKVDSEEMKLLLGLLEAKMKPMSIELRISNLYYPSGVNPGIPLLIICVRNYSYLHWRNSGRRLPVGFDGSSKMALVTVHQREIDDLKIPNTTEESLRKLGGIFDFGYKRNSKKYEFDESTVNSIFAFLMKEGTTKKPIVQGTRV